MADNADKISQFCVVTGVEEERARFYLESSAWQLDVSSPNNEIRISNLTGKGQNGNLHFFAVFERR